MSCPVMSCHRGGLSCDCFLFKRRPCHRRGLSCNAFLIRNASIKSRTFSILVLATEGVVTAIIVFLAHHSKNSPSSYTSGVYQSITRNNWNHVESSIRCHWRVIRMSIFN